MSEVRVFFHKHLLSSLTEIELTTLRSDFKSYKNSGALPDTFGRDALYNHPNSLPIVISEQIAHIHLAVESITWSDTTLQFYRTSDSHLIYCQGFIKINCYLVMAILSPNAHSQARDNSIMHSLGKMAEKFHQQY